MRRRLLIGAAAAAVAAAALLLGGLSRSDASRVGPATRPEAALAAGFAAGDTVSLVAQLQAGLRARPDDVRGLDLLGLAYQQRARETGDPAWYAKSDGVLRKALQLVPNDLLATVYYALGIDPDMEIRNHLNQPRELVKGKVVVDLWS